LRSAFRIFARMSAPLPPDSDDALPVEEGALPMPEAAGGGLFGDPTPAPAPEPAPEAAPAAPYRVLARKYRPQTFDDLIGQESTVRILRRAFALNRVAHAYLLTGVRGVGKTTTARIIARALNCIGPDGKGGPTADPCGVCANCTAILADRHPDVLEMDAASRTGVDDVREIVEATRYRPIQARMKVFIIDEVHMLSRNAFNALLKTLEEPPSQVTFVFATTELRKVPVTVLSRCQRFDLRRVPQAMLTAHFEAIAQKEGAVFAPEALQLIARAADGSVRDGLSLLDQAIASGQADGAERIEPSAVSAMLGLADRVLMFDLLDALMAGKPDAALAITDQAYAHGADPSALMSDLLDLTHLVTRLKTVPDLRDGVDLPEAERTRGGALADRLSMATLSRAWQMLLKGAGEVTDAPDPRMAADMVLLRLCYVAELPTPDAVIRALRDAPAGGSAGAAGQAPGQISGGSDPTGHVAPPGGSGSGLVGAYGRGSGAPDTGQGTPPRAHLRLVANGGTVEEHVPTPEPETGTASVPEPAPEPAPSPEEATPSLRSWREVVAFVAQTRSARLHGLLRNGAHLVRFAPPEIVLRFQPGIPARTDRDLERLLREHAGPDWRVELSREAGEPTLDEQGAEVIALHQTQAEAHPLVQAILAAFPTARVGEVRDHTLDEYGLPPEELPEHDGASVPTALGGEAEAPDLDFAPDDADFLDERDVFGS
jgi:DNA polymerase III subunit gamma/tau